MKNLKIVYTETHHVKKLYVEKIDPTSLTQWASLIEKVRSRIDDDSFIDDLPTEPSDDLEDWLTLFYFLDADDYSQKVESEAEIEKSLICEREWSIKNQDGEILIQDFY